MTYPGAITYTGSAGSYALNLATNDGYASMRVISNNMGSAPFNDGMYIGYGNASSGITRIFGGGATSGGISVNGGGVNDVLIAGNVVLNAGNYNSYSPTLTGGGASGTWGINITGNAATVSSITPNTALMVNRFTPTSFIDGLTTSNFRSTLFGTSSNGAAIAAARWNNVPTPLSGMTAYGTMIAWSGDSDTQGFLALNYETPGATVGGGNANLINWTKRLAFSDGTGASGTWGINITGSANYATSAGSASVASRAYYSIDGFYNEGNHGSSWIQNELPAANNGAATGRVVLRQWCSEPGVTWDWAGFGYNVLNDGGSPNGFGRFNGNFGQAYMRFATNGDWYFYNTTVGGTRTTSMSFSSTGAASFGSTISNGSVWINNGSNSGSYNENIRLFNAPNGVSVIAFSASGVSGTPTTSILGYSDRMEFRYNDGAQFRIYNGYTESMGSSRAPIFYDSNDTNYYLDPNASSVLNTVYIAGTLRNNSAVSDDDAFGLYFDSGASTAYAIYREAGAWSFPFPDLRIAFHTGIKFGANASYKGMNFYTDYDMVSLVMSVNNADYNTGGIYVHGTAYASAYYETSDARLKTILEDNSRVKDIQLIKPKLYKKDGKTEFGYIAQDFLEIMPYAVNNDNVDNMYSLVYREVHTAKIAYIEDEVDILKKEVKELKSKLQKYEA
jgi:hypothetical protein